MRYTFFKDNSYVQLLKYTSVGFGAIYGVIYGSENTVKYMSSNYL